MRPAIVALGARGAFLPDIAERATRVREYAMRRFPNAFCDLEEIVARMLSIVSTSFVRASHPVPILLAASMARK